MANGYHLDDPKRYEEIKNFIRNKKSLQSLYMDTYQKYSDCVARCPKEGKILELGSGGGFLKEYIPEALTSDVIGYPDLDCVVDATQMPFPDQSLKLICMQNVFHHIPNVELFFKEASRCLVPGGRIFIVDQYLGALSSLIYRYLHHEPFLKNSKEWSFNTSGPLSGANGALAWIVFFRDRVLFEKKYPQLSLEKITPHTPFRYWLSGGLKNWNLTPSFGIAGLKKLDDFLVSLSPRFASFMDIEIVKK